MSDELERRVAALEAVAFGPATENAIERLEDQLMRERRRAEIATRDYKNLTEKLRGVQAQLAEYEREYGQGKGIKVSRDQAEGAIEWFLAAATGSKVPEADWYEGFIVFERLCSAFGYANSIAYDKVYNSREGGA